jgi:hypothetical protein
MKHIYPALLVLFAGTPAIAQTEWERAIARGLETFTLLQGEGTVTLTCDPDRVFGSNVTNASLRVVFPKDPAPSRFVILASDGTQVSFTMTDGGANEVGVDALDWDKMVGILSAGGAFAFVTGQDALQFEDVTPLPDLKC